MSAAKVGDVVVFIGEPQRGYSDVWDRRRESGQRYLVVDVTEDHVRVYAIRPFVVEGDSMRYDTLSARPAAWQVVETNHTAELVAIIKNMDETVGECCGCNSTKALSAEQHALLDELGTWS